MNVGISFPSISDTKKHSKKGRCLQHYGQVPVSSK